MTRFIALICILPLFAQSFYYLLPMAPLYYLSKAWPVIMLPAAAWALTRLQLQSRTIYVVWLAYALGLTPLISMMQLGAGFFDALTTTVKVWPFTYYFSLLGVLCWLRPTARQIERAVLGLGAATFVLMALLWVLVPASWYTVDATNSKFFIYEIRARQSNLHADVLRLSAAVLSGPAAFFAHADHDGCSDRNRFRAAAVDQQAADIDRRRGTGRRVCGLPCAMARAGFPRRRDRARIRDGIHTGRTGRVAWWICSGARCPYGNSP